MPNEPLDPTRKALVLQQKGLDPKQWDITPDFQIVPVSGVSPSISSDEQYQQKPTDMQSSPVNVSPSPMATAAMSFGEAVPSTLGAGLGAAGATALAASIYGAPLGPVGMLGAGLVGAIGGGIAGNAAREVIEPEEWQVKTAEAQAANPYSGIAGQLAAMPLGGFNPSVANVGRAMGSIGKLATGLAPEAGEVGN